MEEDYEECLWESGGKFIRGGEGAIGIIEGIDYIVGSFLVFFLFEYERLEDKFKVLVLVYVVLSGFFSFKICFLEI